MDELIRRAEHIRRMTQELEAFQQILHIAQDCLQANKAECAALGIVGDEPYSTDLEQAIHIALEEQLRLICKLDECASNYVEAMKNCVGPAHFLTPPQLFI